jgi:AraC-like DNA-binding protein
LYPSPDEQCLRAATSAVQSAILFSLAQSPLRPAPEIAATVAYELGSFCQSSILSPHQSQLKHQKRLWNLYNPGSSGKLRSAELAGQVGIGVRQFQREFSARFGASPKLFSRIVRFQNALDTKARSSKKSWTDVAHELGYYDQMHMVHDFREFTGESPTETLRQLELLFREQIDAVRAGRAAERSNMVPRFVI